jgi:C-terminal processing protease CtpA/Prc
MRLVALSLALSALGCAGLGSLPLEPPPLELEEPLPLFQEPDDEAARAALPAGSFTGVYVADARESLEDLLGEPEGLLVERVIENSPGEIAGLEAGDLLLSLDAGAGPRRLAWPSEWHTLELETEPGAKLRVVYDRAGAERECEIVPLPRVRPRAREDTQRFREDRRVGLVVRTATEVEARAAGLGPGGGAVIVGLAPESPWRAAGLSFGDLVAEVDGEPIAHPEVLLAAIRTAPEHGALQLVRVRDGVRTELAAPLSQRERVFREFRIPLLARYENDGRRRELSLLLGLFRRTRTEAAWRMTLLWFIHFGGGDVDRLVEVGG